MVFPIDSYMDNYCVTFVGGRSNLQDSLGFLWIHRFYATLIPDHWLPVVGVAKNETTIALRQLRFYKTSKQSCE